MDKGKVLIDDLIIARFMNLKFNNDDNCWVAQKNEREDIDYEELMINSLSVNDGNGELNFSKSFDWLMQVVQKICKLKSTKGLSYKLSIKNVLDDKISYITTISEMGEYSFDNVVISSNKNESLIKSIYLTVVDFIKFYTI